MINVLKDAKQEVPQDLIDLARLNNKFKKKGKLMLNLNFS